VLYDVLTGELYVIGNVANQTAPTLITSAGLPCPPALSATRHLMWLRRGLLFGMR
jgi:hypothetical protein